jgi:(E)-4-hydroxy-3-methylbut-2-enyl-diphosphate synthase
VGFVLTVGPATIARGRALAEVLWGDDALIFLEGPASGSTGALVAGTLLTDGVGDVLCLTEPGTRADATDIAPPWPAGGVAWDTDPVAASYLLLQACRLRLTRAEFIACPSCGRTQFDLQTTTARIRARTEHLSGVKIAIMGCIVNGPGEMADADFGYVGSGSGRVDLYVGKERVARNIPAAEAEDRLVTLLDEHGAWQDPPGDD